MLFNTERRNPATRGSMTLAELSEALPPTIDDLGNPIYLQKQDVLRDIGIETPPLQIVLIGGPSSGKTSLLERLTGCILPYGGGPTTRFVTRLTFRRDPIKSIVAFITPRGWSHEDRVEKLRSFHHVLDNLDAKALADTVEEAAAVMGIRKGFADNEDDVSLYSEDILEIQISGPDQPNLAFIDTPGLLGAESLGPDNSGKKKRSLIDGIAWKHLMNEQTIILAVFSSFSDRAKEDVLRLAKAADPKGKRTLCVLTHADVVKGRPKVQTILTPARNTHGLGCFWVRNRGADEGELSAGQCRTRELALFAESRWASFSKLGRTGVDALKSALRMPLRDLAKDCLQRQRTEVLRRLSACKKERLALGPPRDTPNNQREYLMERVSTFERLASAALEGLYGADRLFTTNAVYRLVTNITDLNYNFCSWMRQRGQTYYFKNEVEDGQFDFNSHNYMEGLKELREWAASCEELGEFLHPEKGEEVDALKKQEDSIMAYLRAVTSGLPRVGIQSTPGESIFTMIFQEQAETWTLHANYLMKLAIFMVHRFICQLMIDVFGDSRIRTELQDLLSEKILKAYKRAWDHKEFLVKMELRCRSQTYNPHLDAAILKIGRENFRTTLIKSYNDQKCRIGFESAFNAAVKAAFDSSGVEDDLHDLLQAYYTIATDRFLDNICRQAVSYFLLEADDSPVKILTADFIANLSVSQLDRIAGEDAITRATRLSLDAECEPLENALKVLRE